MLYIIEISSEDGFFKRFVYTSEIERDYNYDVLMRDYGENHCIRKMTFKRVEE